MKIKFILVFVFVCISDSFAEVATRFIPDNIENQYIVVFHDEVNAKAKLTEIESLLQRKIVHNYKHVLKAISTNLSRDQVRIFEKDNSIKYIENVEFFNLHSQIVPGGIDRINAELSPSAKINGIDERVNIDVAIIDSGVDLDHPDLYVFKYAYCYQSLPLPSTCTENDIQADDAIGHGTHVAGIVGALDNNIGVVGVAPGARIWAIDITRPDNSITTLEILDALEYVYENASEIDVVNMSLGFVGQSTTVDNAISTLVNTGVVFVTSAGNDAIDVLNVSPAGHPDAITVSAFADFDGFPGRLSSETYIYSMCTESLDDSMACFSNYGSGVDISAPGTKIYSTYLNGGYAELHGTSMASPHVAGLAALYLAENPNQTPVDVKNYLISSGDNTPCGVTGLICDDDPDFSNEPLSMVKLAFEVYDEDIPFLPVWAFTSLILIVMLSSYKNLVQLKK